PELLADLCPTGFARAHDIMAAVPEPVLQQAGLRRLSDAVTALQSDEQTGHATEPEPPSEEEAASDFAALFFADDPAEALFFAVLFLAPPVVDVLFFFVAPAVDVFFAVFFLAPPFLAGPFAR